MEKERLDKYLSNQLNISRSEARTSVRRGRVAVGGAVIKDFAFLVNAETDSVELDGKVVPYRRYIYLLLNKPAGVITASNDKSRKTVLDLVPEELRRRNLAPVGRLDKDTTGLLILTDDGDFAHKCISPKNEVEKSYIAELDGDINADIIAAFENGVVLADGYVCKPAKLFDLGENRVRVIITEGKYHQIKRMFGVFSLGVNRLHRESVGALGLPDNMERGECLEVPEMREILQF